VPNDDELTIDLEDREHLMAVADLAATRAAAARKLAEWAEGQARTILDVLTAEERAELAEAAWQRWVSEREDLDG
jgi:hypothetical protein